jgi:hypothetical protein
MLQVVSTDQKGEMFLGFAPATTITEINGTSCETAFNDLIFPLQHGSRAG